MIALTLAMNLGVDRLVVVGEQARPMYCAAAGSRIADGLLGAPDPEQIGPGEGSRG